MMLYVSEFVLVVSLEPFGSVICEISNCIECYLEQCKCLIFNCGFY